MLVPTLQPKVPQLFADLYIFHGIGNVTDQLTECSMRLFFNSGLRLETSIKVAFE